MIRTNRLTGLLAVAAICLAVAGSSHAQIMNFTIDGVERQALILAPSNASESGKRLPLLFAFHGHGGTMVQTAAQMRFDKVWPEAIIVYMQGLPTKTSGDPDSDQPGWQHEPGEVGDRDLTFFDAVMARVRTVFQVDDSPHLCHRIFEWRHIHVRALGRARKDVRRACSGRRGKIPGSASNCAHPASTYRR